MSVDWRIKMPNTLPPEILKLSAEERLALVDLIYESIDEDAFSRAERIDDGKMLPNQQAELERRFAEYDANPDSFIPVEQLLAEMK